MILQSLGSRLYQGIFRKENWKESQVIIMINLFYKLYRPHLLGLLNHECKAQNTKQLPRRGKPETP